MAIVMLDNPLSQVIHWVAGGWSHLHNNATLWPNLQVRTCKNSSQVEFQVGPSVEKLKFSVVCPGLIMVLL